MVSLRYKMKYARNPRYWRTGLAKLVVKKINANSNDDAIVNAAMADIDAEYAALVAESALTLV